MAKPLAIDLYCGLGGWTEALLAEGWDVIGFDIERRPYPGQLVLQDVLTLSGRQFSSASLIVASPPCQAYSYRSMPWRALWLEHARMDDDGAPAGNYLPPDPISNDHFRACFRIACEAGNVPLIVENVKGAQRWVGAAAWHYGDFYLWGDVPALMPFGERRLKGSGGSWFTFPGDKVKSRAKHWKEGGNISRRFSSKSVARKAASAQIAKIPEPLARHIARIFKP